MQSSGGYQNRRGWSPRGAVGRGESLWGTFAANAPGAPQAAGPHRALHVPMLRPAFWALVVGPGLAVHTVALPSLLVVPQGSLQCQGPGMHVWHFLRSWQSWAAGCSALQSVGVIGGKGRRSGTVPHCVLVPRSWGGCTERQAVGEEVNGEATTLAGSVTGSCLRAQGG